MTGTTDHLVTGYQYGDNGTYIGVYHFEKNRDKDEVHCPLRTTLVAPPIHLAADEQAFFDGRQWQVRRLTLPWLPDRDMTEPEEPQEPEENEGENHGN